MVKLEDINSFLKQKNVALIGVSENKSKFGNAIFKELRTHEYSVYPIHPRLQKIDEVDCYRDIHELPEDVTAIIICTKPENVIDILVKSVQKGIRYVWLQQGAESSEAITFAKENGMTCIYKSVC